MLRPQRQEWNMVFVSSGAEALAALTESKFDVLVTDMRMPGMDGAELLAHVRVLYPHMVRIILTGQCSRDSFLRAVQLAHRHLGKPCDVELLKATLTRACALRQLLTNSTLVTLASRIDSVPSLPSLYFEVVRELEGPDPSLQKVGKIIARAAGMTARISGS